MQPLEVNLLTSDETQIAGIYIPGSLPFGVVMLHMLPTDKSSYDMIAQKLNIAGYHTLAIDLRGHGESGGGEYQNFTDEQHQKSIFDVMAAVDYLHRQDEHIKIGLMGASIGANLAMQYAAANQTEFLVLLSPGLNYHGVETGRTAVAIPEVLPVLFVSSLDDERVDGNAAQTETLYNSCSSQNKAIKVLRSAGHGTNMFNNDPNLADSVVEWIRESISLTHNSI